MGRRSIDKFQGPGRPSAYLQRHVVEDLIRATEDALDRKTVREVTLREIASAAGTSEAMVRYYFGGKDGIFLELMKDFMSDSPHRDNKYISSLCIKENTVKPLVDRLFGFLYGRPSIIKMLAVELFSSSSEVRKLFLYMYGSCVNDSTERIIDEMKAAGIYRHSVNSNFIVISLMGLIVSPIMECAVTGSSTLPPKVHNGEWSEFISSSIDAIAK